MAILLSLIISSSPCQTQACLLGKILTDWMGSFTVYRDSVKLFLLIKTVKQEIALYRRISLGTAHLSPHDAPPTMSFPLYIF